MAEDEQADRIEQVRCVWNRYNEACGYQFRHDEALAFARSSIDVGRLRHLRALKCPPPLAARILL